MNLIFFASFFGAGWMLGRLNIPGRWASQDPVTQAFNAAKQAAEQKLVKDLMTRMSGQAPTSPPASESGA